MINKVKSIEKYDKLSDEKTKKIILNTKLFFAILVCTIISNSNVKNNKNFNLEKEKLVCTFKEKQIFEFLSINPFLGLLNSKMEIKKEELDKHSLELLKFTQEVGVFRKKVTDLAESKDKEVKLIKKRTNKKIIKRKNLIDYAINFFQSTSSVNKKKGIEKMPEKIRIMIAPIIPGLISQESKFQMDAISPAGAIGATQILPENTSYKREDFLKSFHLQIKECYRNFERIWSAFNNGVRYTYKGKNKKINSINFNSFAKKYGLSENEINQFIVLSMLNAYNTGETRMLRIIHKFEKEVSGEIATQRTDKTAEGLFQLMIELAYKKGWEKGYKKESYNYTISSLAYAKALGILERENSDFISVPRNNEKTFETDFIHLVIDNTLKSLNETLYKQQF